MTAMMRAAALRGLPPLVSELGGDGAELLTRLKVPEGAVDSDSALLPTVTVNRLLEAAAEEVARPDFGLLLADRQDIGTLGPLAVALQASTTVAGAFACAVRFLFVHSPDLTLTLEDDPWGDQGLLAVTYRNAFTGSSYSPQAMELGIGLTHRICQLLCADAYAPRSVHFAHQPLSPSSSYREFFETDVRFGQADAMIRVSRALLTEPIPGGNETMHAIAVSYLESTFTAPKRGVADRVRRVLDDTIGSAAHTVDSVAKTLLMHPRTLQRHLASEGATFEGILDDVRRRIAHRVIVETDLPLRQVASMVGLAEHAVLTRAVRRWFGKTPSALRRGDRDLVEQDLDNT